jgi:hypothetical protein
VELHRWAGTKMIAKTLCMKLYPFALAASVIYTAYVAEPLYFPVVRDWTVTEVHREGSNVVITGYMKKTRSCKFNGVTATDDNDVVLPLVLLEGVTDPVRRKPSGAVDWGPWKITLESAEVTSKISLSITHQCHVGWLTTTELGEVNLFSMLKDK